MTAEATRESRELSTVIMLWWASCCERNRSKHHIVKLRKMLWEIHSVFLRSSFKSVEFQFRAEAFSVKKEKSIEVISKDWCLLSEIMKFPIKWLINKNKTVANPTGIPQKLCKFSETWLYNGLLLEINSNGLSWSEVKSELTLKSNWIYDHKN